MMKKLGLFAFVMALVVAFALPAFAYTVEGAKGERFTIGGVMNYDLGYRNVNKDYATVASPGFGGKDNTRFFQGLDYWSNIYILLNVGDASFFARIYTNADTGTYNKWVNDSGVYGAADFANFNDYIAMDTFYGSYKFGALTISAGKQEASTLSWGMSQRLGYTPSAGGHVAGIAYGFVYDNKYPQLRLRHDISKIFAYQISLVQTGTYAEPSAATNTAPGTTTTIINGTTTTLQPTATTGIRQSYAEYPMIAAKVMLNFGMVQVNPAAAYQKVKWDALQAGWDTDMTAWLARLPVKFIMGPFTAQGEITYGQNLGAPGSKFANICSGEASYGGYARNASGKILNANTLAYFADLAYTFGPVTPHIYYGQTTSKNGTDRYPTGDTDNTRMIYGINAYYTVTPNFLIIPEFYWSDLGKVPGTAGLKLGGDWVGGVNFSFFF